MPEAERGKRITVYFTPEMLADMETIYRILVDEGLVPRLGDPNKYRSYILRLCVENMVATRQGQAQELTHD